MTKTKTYFLSDLHLGLNTAEQSSKDREALVVEWLDSIKNDAKTIYFVGDIFDYWYEYKEVVPRGYIRFLAKLSALIENGTEIVFFTGNHDVWFFDYFENEIGIQIRREATRENIDNKQFFIAHGDGLGNGDTGYKVIKKIFTSSICQWAFARIHPNTGLRLMRFLSTKSRENHDDDTFIAENERMFVFAKEECEDKPFDYFVCGHRHKPADIRLNDRNARFINLGDWISHRSFAVLDQGELALKFFKNDQGKYIS